MKLIAVFLLMTLCCSSFAQSNITKTEGKGWTITTEQSEYRIQSDGKQAVPVYYGPKDYGMFGWSQRRDFPVNEIPVRGGTADKTPILEAVYHDGVRDIELTLNKEEIIDIDGRETLKLTYSDSLYSLRVVSFTRVFPEYDVIEKWMEIENVNSKHDIKFENVKSGSMFLQSGQYILTHHSSRWGCEFILKSVELSAGIKKIFSTNFQTFQNTPWFCLNKVGNENGVWFGELEYSGNWEIDFNMFNSGQLQVTGGINFWDTDLTLTKGKKFTTPKICMGYCDEGQEGAMHRLHSVIRNEKLPQNFRNVCRPVIYNSWYATTFGVNEEQQLKLAETAKEVGVELFVIDDGWFKGRVNDQAGLGDWTVDRNKFPNGLNPLIDKIHQMGMMFGIWVEPEMVNPNSDLYRKHPEWALHFPNRYSTKIRHQYMLNLAREDVYQYLLETMTDLLSNHKIDFIKWDRNRGISQPGWDAQYPREVRIRFIENLYRLIDTLREKFPNVIFEGCSGGGGRTDIGMLNYVDQIWTSDNTSPADRLFIQYGYLSGWPANTMVCWSNNDQYTEPKYSLEFSMDVAMQGVLGIAQNISRWDTDTKGMAKKKIEEYKQIRNVIQNGTVHRLISPYNQQREALEYVSQNKDTVVVLCYNFDIRMTDINLDIPQLKLRGLESGATYTMGGTEYSSDALMNSEFKWPVYGDFKSKVLIFTKK